MLLVIVATGNHFFLDAAAGAITVAVAAASARVIMRRPNPSQLGRLPEQLLACWQAGKGRGVTQCG